MPRITCKFFAITVTFHPQITTRKDLKLRGSE